MTTLQRIEGIYNTMLSTTKQTLEMSLADTHHSGIFSLVIGGETPGNLTRVFISDVKLKPFEVQLHTHRYPLWLTTIKGNIRHYEAEIVPKAMDGVRMSRFEYRSPLNGGAGLKAQPDCKVTITDYGLPPGSSIWLRPTDFHTMSCSKGSIWVVEEGGFSADTSEVLGVPFITEGLYNKPEMFQINDKFQIVKAEIRRIIEAFKSV